jgi:hypothetical protein
VKFSAANSEQRAFAQHAPLYGFRPEDYGKEFTIGDQSTTYRLTGINPRSHSMPLLAEDANGRRLKFRDAAVDHLVFVDGSSAPEPPPYATPASTPDAPAAAPAPTPMTKAQRLEAAGIFDRVNVLVADGMTRTDAFSQLAQESGKRPGHIAAFYYRAARTANAA